MKKCTVSKGTLILFDNKLFIRPLLIHANIMNSKVVLSVCLFVML